MNLYLARPTDGGGPVALRSAGVLPALPSFMSAAHALPVTSSEVVVSPYHLLLVAPACTAPDLPDRSRSEANQASVSSQRQSTVK